MNVHAYEVISLRLEANAVEELHHALPEEHRVGPGQSEKKAKIEKNMNRPVDSPALFCDSLTELVKAEP